jgi:vacuolar-type H+-ATPase subunit F/Vma7
MRVIFLGSEAEAAGYRLAGVDARSVDAACEHAALADARANGELVLVAASVAARLPESTMRAACAALAPLVVVVPDLGGEGALPDVAQRLRRQLGLVESS